MNTSISLPNNNTIIFSSSTVPLFKGGWPLDLTLQKNKIIIIAFCALGLLTALCLARKLNRKPLIMEDKLVGLNGSNIVEDSLKRIKNLSVLPENKEIETEDGIYLNPSASLLDLNSFLEPYTIRSGYAGVSFSMKTNEIYGKTIPNQLFSAAYFKKKDSSPYHSISNFFKFSSQPINLEIQKKELEELVFPMIDKWGYSSVQIGNVNEEFFSNKQTKSDYELYLLLFYKKQEKST